MAKSWEIRLSGIGGQGLILAGIILAEAGILDGFNAMQSQSYGPEARGGASKAEVIISDGEINYPKVNVAEIFLAMSSKAYEKYSPQVKEKGIVIVDSTLVENVKEIAGQKVYRIPITEIAKSETGGEMTANIVALGVLMEITGVVSIEALQKAVLARIPIGTEEMNLTALKAGLKAVKECVH